MIIPVPVFAFNETEVYEKSSIFKRALCSAFALGITIQQLLVQAVGAI